MKPIKGYRAAEVRVSYTRKGQQVLSPITTSADAYQAVLPGFNQRTMDLQEQFVVLYLNRANIPLALYRLSQGGITGTVADPRLIFSVGLKVAAVAFIMAHNHPSGNLRPSSLDQALTSKLKDAGRLLDILLLDHLIISRSGNYVSFADDGLL